MHLLVLTLNELLRKKFQVTVISNTLKIEMNFGLVLLELQNSSFRPRVLFLNAFSMKFQNKFAQVLLMFSYVNVVMNFCLF